MPFPQASPRLATMPEPFRCEVFPERDRVRIVPLGELDIATAPLLESTIRELLTSGFDHLVLDLTDLDFIDSTGLHLILSLQAAAADGGYRLRLKPGRPAVQRIFELTQTLDLVSFEAGGITARRLVR
jgi:anti-sigma B factor antagonist